MDWEYQWSLEYLNHERLNFKKKKNIHCVKSAHIRSYSGPFFPAFKSEGDTTELLQHNFYFDIWWILFIRRMTLNRVKVGRAVSFVKYLSGVVSLMFLPKTLIWNKITFPASNLLNFAELVKNELMKSISKKFINISFSVQFITAYSKDFKSL